MEFLNTDKEIKGMPFQIFGFDILVDSKMKAWILEINDHPSFNVVTCNNDKKCQHEDCPISKVDMAVK